MSKAASLAMKLRSLCLAAMSAKYEELAQRAGQEGWTPIRYLEYLCDTELAERSRRKTERLLKQSNLPQGKTYRGMAAGNQAGIQQIRKGGETNWRAFFSPLGGRKGSEIPSQDDKRVIVVSGEF
jgi:DNA replication protein DnaC